MVGQVEASLAFALQPPTVPFFLEAATDRQFLLETKPPTEQNFWASKKLKSEIRMSVGVGKIGAK
jgi:hypothetical protein